MDASCPFRTTYFHIFVRKKSNIGRHLPSLGQPPSLPPLLAQSGQHRCLSLISMPDETPGSPRLTLEKTSCSESAAETARNKNRGCLHGTVVKTFGRLYNEFLPTKRSIVQENGVRRAHEVPTRQGARPPPSWKPHVLSGLLFIFLFS